MLESATAPGPITARLSRQYFGEEVEARREDQAVERMFAPLHDHAARGNPFDALAVCRSAKHWGD